MNDISEEKVRNAVAQVKHPAIDRTLMELGILKDITIEGDTVFVTLAFPFPGIPIRELLVESVRKPVEELGAKVEVKTGDDCGRTASFLSYGAGSVGIIKYKIRCYRIAHLFGCDTITSSI